MTDDRHQRLAAWFEEASGCTGAERQAFLDRCRAEDSDLARELAELLDHDTRGSEALDAGLDTDAVAALAADVVAASVGEAGGEGDLPGGEDGAELPEGRTVGPYTIARRLGAGGFAVVYEAHQSEPVTRDVALKVLRPGMDSKQVLARFAAELQAQARMNHEHVARVLDAGRTDAGRPYLAMELVDGRPITRWCEQRQLGLRARLELFVQACEAVQHAHQKGVVHRDLKASNVLVGEGGADGSVKIIDFGIAKAIEGSLTEDTLRTLEGQLVGTPESMSPEQAAGRAEDVDTRTDVYALGVLLYELLAGARPFDFARTTLVEIQRTILEVDPPRPSQRLVPGHADAAWERALRTELDWVVMRALEKDPERRYDTVAGLAADVQRFLRDEPVEASPPSRAVRLRKFVRRNRTGVTAASLVALSLVGGLVWSLVERARADAAAARESEAKGEAQARATELEEVSAFQERQFLDLDTEAVGRRIRDALLEEVAAARARRAGTDGAVAADGDRTAAEDLAELEALLQGTNFTTVAVDTLDATFLRSAIESVDERFAGQPRIRARLLRATGRTQNGMGLLREAVPTLERALEEARLGYGEDDPETLEAWLSYAEALREADDRERARAELDGLLRFTEGRDDLVQVRLHALQARTALARMMGDREAAERLSREILDLARAHFEPGSYEVASAKAARTRVETDPEVLEALYLSVIEDYRALFGPDDPQVLRVEENFASFLSRQGRRREAREIRERTVAAFRRALGDRHPSTLRSIENLGLMLWFQDDLEGAEHWIREAYESRLARFGIDHVETLGTGGNLAMVLGEQGRAEEAIELYEVVLPGQRAVLGLEHQDTLGTMTNLSLAYNGLGRYEEARALQEVCLPTKRRVLGPDHPFTRAAAYQLMRAYQGLGREDDARAVNAELLEAMVAAARRDGATAEDVGYAAESLLTTEFDELRDTDLALELAERAVALEERHGGAMLFIQLSRVALAHWYRGDVARAVEVQRQAIERTPAYQLERMRSILGDYEARLEQEGGR